MLERAERMVGYHCSTVIPGPLQIAGQTSSHSRHAEPCMIPSISTPLFLQPLCQMPWIQGERQHQVYTPQQDSTNTRTGEGGSKTWELPDLQSQGESLQWLTCWRLSLPWQTSSLLRYKLPYKVPREGVPWCLLGLLPHLLGSSRLLGWEQSGTESHTPWVYFSSIDLGWPHI